MYIFLNAVREDKPGIKWQELFEKYWPFYEKWYLSEGLRNRPGFTTSFGKLKKYMPELIPVYEKLLALTGNKDTPARFLSMYCPPKYLSACSQLAWAKEPYALVRNYDYDAHKFEGAFLYTNWLQPVIAMSDCIWGVLDGINQSGLSISLAFGGRKVTGDGFGIPIILRYILETCSTTAEAVNVLQRVPSHMAYNVTAIDALGNYTTVYVSPDRSPVVTGLPYGTNHQLLIDWEDYAAATYTRERQFYLETCIANPDEDLDGIISRFLEKPLFNTKYEKGFGTLYTSVYLPQQKKMQLIWPKNSWTQSFDDFTEQKIVVNATPPGAKGSLVK